MNLKNESPRKEGSNVVEGGQAKATCQNRQAQSSIDVLKSKSTTTEAQHAKLLALLRMGPQTTYNLRKHGIAQCAARVFHLRKLGHLIATEKVTATDSDGFIHVGVARYSLLKEVHCQHNLSKVCNA